MKILESTESRKRKSADIVKNNLIVSYGLFTASFSGRRLIHVPYRVDFNLVENSRCYCHNNLDVSNILTIVALLSPHIQLRRKKGVPSNLPDAGLETYLIRANKCRQKYCSKYLPAPSITSCVLNTRQPQHFCIS